MSFSIGTNLKLVKSLVIKGFYETKSHKTYDKKLKPKVYDKKFLIMSNDTRYQLLYKDTDEIFNIEKYFKLWEE